MCPAEPPALGLSRGSRPVRQPTIEFVEADDGLDETDEESGEADSELEGEDEPDGE